MWAAIEYASRFLVNGGNMDRRYQVFVSSTFKDLKDERKAVMEAVQKAGHIPAGMEFFPAQNAQTWLVIQRIIQASDYYVLIIGGRYGTMTDEGISYTEKEYDYAHSRNMHVIAFIHSDIGELQSARVDADPEKVRKLTEFVAKVESRHTREPWTTMHDLVPSVLTALMFGIQSHPAVGWVRGDALKRSEELQERLNESLKQNDELRQANEELKLRLALVEPNEIERTLAGPDDPVELEAAFTLEKTVWPNDGTTPYNPIEARAVHTTWGEVFRAIAGDLYGRRTRYEVEVTLLKKINPTCSEPHSKVHWNPHSIEAVRVQLIAMGLIHIQYSYEGLRDPRNEYWVLNRSGELFFAPYVAQIKGSDG
ncbi:MAG: DUF4062 domain-containing protein [Aureliella sp.]